MNSISANVDPCTPLQSGLGSPHCPKQKCLPHVSAMPTLSISPGQPLSVEVPIPIFF